MGKALVQNWVGLGTAISPYVLPPGATVRQSNLQIKRPGELRQRPGMDSVYMSADYSEILGMYRVSNGSVALNDLIVSARTSETANTLRYQTPTGVSDSWSVTPAFTITTSSLVSPSFAEDRHGRIYVFHGNGVDPLVVSRKTKLATTAGLVAPTIAPAVTPSGNGYFIERVDVLEGGGSYWAAPDIVVTGGGSRTRGAKLKAIVQGGSVVAVDVVDGGSGYQTAPTLTVDESGVKGVGFRGYGVIGVDPGIQGFEPVFISSASITNGSTSVSSVGQIESVRVGATVSGTGIQSGTTVLSRDPVARSLTLSLAAQATNASAQLTFNEGVRTGSTGSTSHGLNLDVSATTIAYSFTSTVTLTNGQAVISNVASLSRLLVGAIVIGGTGVAVGTTVTAINADTGQVTLSANATSSGTQTLTFMQGAIATYDGVNGKYTALIPLTAGTNASTSVQSVGTGASALVSFTVLLDTLSRNVNIGGSADPSWPLQYSWLGASASTLTTANDYWVNTDDCSQIATNTTITWAYAPYQWKNNNWDFFAAFAPSPRVNFHSRCAIAVKQYQNSGTGGTTYTPFTVYSDLYAYDFGYISLRYFTGGRTELETASDTSDKWVWVTLPVGVSVAGVPYVDVTLTPAKKTSTTNYTTYSNYTPPVVRVWLTYCPDSWVSGVNDNQINVGWRRTVGSTRPGTTGNATNAATVTTAKGWWCAGAAETGVSRRPIVNFRQGPNLADGAGLTSQSVEVLNTGSGMELHTFFAIQFDQVNASRLFEGPNYQQTVAASNYADNSILRPSPGNPASILYSISDMEFAPASPAYSDEWNQTFNTARFNKTFSQYRQRLYFWADSIDPGQQGPPGLVMGTPSVTVPGSNFLTGDRASFTLQQRSDLTSSATFTQSYTYTFTARQITPAASTNSITSVVVSSSGTNYYGTPTLTFTGVGYGLEMDAVISGGAITQVNVLNGGSGFTTSPVVTAEAEKAKIIPVMRPAMRGAYRCAYRYADWTETEVAQTTITTVQGSTSATVASAAEIEPGIVIDSNNTPFMAKVVSRSGTTIVLSAAATATGSTPAIARDMTKPIYYSNFSPITDINTLDFAANPRPTTLTWSLSGVTPPSRATVVEFFRTSGDQSLVFYRLEQYGRVSGNSVSIVGSDTMTDEDLFNASRPFYAALPVVLPNGGLNAYRFGVPRTDMSVCAAYGDRLWYAVSTSGEYANSIFFSEYDEFESCPAENEVSIQNNQKSTDSLTGLIPFANYLLCMQNAHCYGLSYNTDPALDASIQLLAHRGMLSQTCHDLFDDMVFAMDERGIYKMDRSGSVESLSDNIRNYFDNNLLDLTYRKRFFLKVDQRTSILRAFVVTKDSGASSPNVALCYHINLKAWWTESWPTGLTCGTDYRKAAGEQDQPVYGSVDGDIYREGGLRDYPYRSIRSVTVTNGGSNYQSAPAVTVSSGQPGCGAKFTAVLKDGAVSEILIDEAGFGYGTLVGGTLTNTVNLTIEPPASGTTATATATCNPLALGTGAFPQTSVPYAVRTGAMELVNDGNSNSRDALIDRSVSVVYRPTATNSTLNLREFFNNSAQPRANAMPRDRGTGFVHSTTGAQTSLNMSASRSPLGQATGVAKAQFAGRNYSDMGGADRHVAVELSGNAVDANATDPTPSEVLLYAMEINGVIANGG